MNVFQVLQTSTRVLVQWQDGSTSEKTAASLISYSHADDQDLWPGDKVSYQPDEEIFQSHGIEFIRTRQVGIVQSVDSPDRIARVRWYEDPLVDTESEEPYRTSLCKYGRISDRVTDVSLYELNTRAGSETCLANMVFVLPEPPLVRTRDMEAFIKSCSKRGKNELSETLTQMMHQVSKDGDDSDSASDSESEDPNEIVEQGILQAMTLWWQDKEKPGSNTNSHWQLDPSQTETNHCFGEIVGLYLDGDIAVRLGACPVPQEIKVRPERVLVVSTGDTEDTDDDDDDDDDNDDDSQWEYNETDTEDSVEVTDNEDIDTLDSSVEPVKMVSRFLGLSFPPYVFGLFRKL